MGVVSFLPGFGWITGKGIGEHAGEAIDMTIKVSNTLSDQFKAGLSNLESYIRSLRPR
jgi:hypothetical protein